MFVFVCSTTVCIVDMYVSAQGVQISFAISASIIQPVWHMTMNISLSFRNLHLSMIPFSYSSTKPLYICSIHSIAWWFTYDWQKKPL